MRNSGAERIRASLRPTRHGALLTAFAAVLLLFVLDAVFAEGTPVHVHLQSSGSSATLTVDGTTQAFTWPRPPATLAILPNTPYVHDWGIDGSETLTLGNLDPAYLASISTNPYIAFDRWLRDEDGYDAWRNVRVADPTTGWIMAPGSSTAVTATVPLPPNFVFDADIYRLEQPVTAQLSAPSGTYALHVDRSGRSISVTSNPIRGTATTLTQWYFPTDPWPFLAINLRTLTYGVASAALLLLLALVLGALVPARLADVFAASRQAWRINRERLLIWLVLAASFAFSIYIALEEYHGNPHLYDAQSYLFQAKTLALGRLSITPPPLLDSFPVPWVGVIRGQWVSQYAPGTALTLVPGVLLGIPWLVQPVLTVATLALVAGIARRLYGWHVALIAVILGALSPLFTILTGTYLSHPPTAFFATLAYYLLIRSGWGRRPWLVTLAGAAGGLAFLCREISGVLVVLPLAVYLIAHLVRSREPGWPRALAGGAAAFGLCIIAYLLYNWRITGSALVAPRNILNPVDQYGFGAGHGWWGQHTLAAGLVNLDQLLTGLTLDLFGWPYYMALAVPLIPFVLGQANRWDVLNAAIVLALCLELVGYFYHGVFYGPRYTYDAVPALLLLAARGVQVLGRAAGNVLAALGRLRPAGPVAAHVILLALILPNVLFYLPRQLELYHGFTGLLWNPHLQLTRIYSGVPAHAIIATPNSSIFSTDLASLNNPADLASPTTTRDTVWAFAPTPARYAQLMHAFPHRRLYILTDNGTSVDLHPWLSSAAVAPVRATLPR